MVFTANNNGDKSINIMTEIAIFVALASYVGLVSAIYIS